MDYLKEISAFNRANSALIAYQQGQSKNALSFSDKLIVLIGNSTHYDSVPVLNKDGKHTGRYTQVNSGMTELAYWAEQASKPAPAHSITVKGNYGDNTIMVTVDEHTSAPLQHNAVFALCWFMTVCECYILDVAYIVADFVSDFVCTVFVVRYNHEAKNWLYC